MYGLICIYIWLIFMVNVNVGKYTSPMDGMGYTLGAQVDHEINSLLEKTLLLQSTIPRHSYFDGC